MPYATVLKTRDGYFLVCSKDGAVAVQDQPGVITKQIEGFTNPLLQRDQGTAVGAFLNSAGMDPKEVALPDDLNQVRAMLDPGEDGKGSNWLISGGGLAGGFHGWKLKEDAAKKLRGET